ncbi:MAG: hypothetical protein OCD00_07595 [Colwellia sp.]
MDNILHIQTALGSLVDLVPEPKRVKRKSHNIKLFYDFCNSDVASAWAECNYEISQSYDSLTEDAEYHGRLALYKDYLKSYERVLDLGKKISLNNVVCENDELHNQACLSEFQGECKITNE